MRTRAFSSPRSRRRRAPPPSAPRLSSTRPPSTCWKKEDAVTSVFAVNGFNFGGRGQNASILFIKLRDWDERGAASLKARAVAARANAHFRKTVRDAMLFVVPPPSVMELGNVTGFDFMLMDRAGVGHEAAGRAQPAAGRRGQEPGAAGRAPERHRGRAAVPARHRPRRRARWAWRCPTSTARWPPPGVRPTSTISSTAVA